MTADRAALDQARDMRATRMAQRDERIQELYACGLDVATIGRRIGMCHAAINYILRKRGVIKDRMRKENLSCAKPAVSGAGRVAPHYGMDGGW